MRVSSPVRRVLAAGLVPLLLVALTACGSDEESTTGEAATTQTATTEGTPSEATASDEPAESPAEEPASTPADSAPGGYTVKTLLPAMKAAVADHRSAHITMNMSGSGQELSAEGDISYDKKAPAMQLTMEGAAFGGNQMEMRVVDGVVYMSIPPMTPQGRFIEIDPNDPNSPLGSGMDGFTDQLDPLSTFDAFDAGLRKVTYVGEESVSGENMDHYVLTVDAAAATKAQGQDMAPGMPETVEYDLWLDDQDLMRKVAFNIGGQVGLDITMSGWGEPVSVEAPSPADIIEAPGTRS